jgi:hypothetical protein
MKSIALLYLLFLGSLMKNKKGRVDSSAFFLLNSFLYFIIFIIFVAALASPLSNLQI